MLPIGFGIDIGLATAGVAAGGGAPVDPNAYLQETGGTDYLLLETGGSDYLLLE
jgi:hypothetical protein